MVDGRLVTRVKAVNLANAYANEIYPILREVFQPFVGKQIMKKEGGFLERVKKVLPELQNTAALSVYRLPSNYSLAFVVKSCQTYNTGDGYGHAYYHETTVYIGELDKTSDVLVKLNDNFKPFRTDYTAEEIEAKRQAYKIAKDAADKAQSALFPFGEIDR